MKDPTKEGLRCRDIITAFDFSLNPEQCVRQLEKYLVLKPTTAGLVFRTLTRTTRRLENSFLCLTYIAETLDVGDGTD